MDFSSSYRIEWMTSEHRACLRVRTQVQRCTNPSARKRRVSRVAAGLGSHAGHASTDSDPFQRCKDGLLI